MQNQLKGLGRNLRHGRALIVLAAAALLVLAMGVAWAEIPDSDDGEIHGCFQKIRDRSQRGREHRDDQVPDIAPERNGRHPSDASAGRPRWYG